MNVVVEYGVSHYERSVRYAVAAGAPYAAAEDIVNEAIASLLQQDPRPARNVAGYWFVTLRHAVKSWLRRELRRPDSLPLLVEAAGAAGAAVDMEDEMAAAELYAFVTAGMTSRGKAALDRCLSGQRPVGNTERQHLFRARRHARKVLSGVR